MDQSITDLLNETFKRKAPVYFSADGTDVTFQTRIIKLEKSRIVLENTIRPEFILAVVGAKKYAILVQMVRFQSDDIKSDGEHLIFPLRENSVVQETRQSERFPFTAEERVVCEILNPFDRETRIHRSVMDMSATGLSLRTTFDSLLYRPGTFFPELKVLIDGKPYTQTAGRVVYNRKLMNAKGQLRLQVGIKFESKGA
jgi:hypothetical protein